MEKSEFDKFADEYDLVLRRNTRIFGESTDFFAEYKVNDVFCLLNDRAKHVKRIVDFGSGVGTSVPHFRRYFPDASLVCLDVSERSLAVGRGRFPDGAEFVPFDGRKIPLEDNSIDLVFAACVFHHISHAEHANLLGEWYRVLKPKGMAVIFEHNPLNPLTVHAVNTCPFDENAELIRGGVMRKRVHQAGFVQIGLHYRLFMPRALRMLRRFERQLRWCPLGAQYFVYASKSEDT